MCNYHNPYLSIVIALALFVLCAPSEVKAAAEALTTVPVTRGQASTVYTVDSNGLLSKIIYGNATSGASLGEIILHTGPWHNEAVVCSLSASFRCDPSLPMLTRQGEPNPMSYGVNEAGVSDGQYLFQWADPAKASRFFASIKQNANNAAINDPRISVACEAQFLGMAAVNPSQCQNSFVAICTSRQGVQQVARDNASIGVGIENVVGMCRSMGYR